MSHTLREPLRAEDAYELDLLLKRLDKLRPQIERGGRVYAVVAGNSGRLAGFLTGACNEIREILNADVDAESQRRESNLIRRAI